MTPCTRSSSMSPRVSLGPFPSADDVGELVERMQHHRVPIRNDGRTVSFEDPWANAVHIDVVPRSSDDA